MSYILEALRKSAEERQKLQNQQENPYEPLPAPKRSSAGKPSVSHRGLIAIAFLAIIALIGGVGWWWQMSADRQMPPPITAKEEPAGPAVAMQQQEESAPDISPPQPQTLPPLPQPQALPPTPTSQIAAAETPTPKPPAIIQSQPNIPPAQRSETPSIITEIPLLQDLPFASQAAIPEMKFSGHAYSPNPDLRMIMVNTSIAREGDMITPDVRLVEITENGLIMIFKDSLFRVELF